MRRALAALLLLALVSPNPGRAQASMTPEQEAAEGIRQVEQGDFETAVITLDSAIKRLDGQPGRQPLVQNALLQLGVALVALEQTDAAKARFRRALELDPKLRLRADAFSPKVIGVFEQARVEAAAAAPPKSGRRLEQAADLRRPRRGGGRSRAGRGRRRRRREAALRAPRPSARGSPNRPWTARTARSSASCRSS